MSGRYPSGPELLEIKAWTREKGWGALLDFVHSIWDCGYTSCYNKAHEDGHFMWFATGGWSGNEELVFALETNVQFWRECWFSSKRGGSHTFVIKSVSGHNHRPKEKEDQYGQCDKRGDSGDDAARAYGYGIEGAGGFS